MPLIEHTNKGLYCPPAKVYIDPWRKVSNALITHGHSDHARRGHDYYVCAESSVNILKHRLGQNINIRGLPYGQVLTVNGVHFSFHPAGHITGSAQIRVEYKGEIWVVTGDYKMDDDQLCTPFEPVPCHHFITECTFGLPVYTWPNQDDVINQIKVWWSKNASEGKTSIINAYSLGKAQRLINSLDDVAGPIFVHDAIHKMNQVYRASGIPLPYASSLKGQTQNPDLQRGLIITPSGAMSGDWLRSVKDYTIASASGWNAIKRNRRRRAVDRGFVLSDHCDWDGLNNAIKATGATHIYPTHGNTKTFAKWLREQGYFSRPIETDYGDIEDDDGIDL